MEENNLEQPEAQSADLNNDGELSAWEKYKAGQSETKVEEVAQENNIEASISAPEQEVTAITSNDLANSTSESQALGSVANGVIGVTSTPRVPEKPSKKEYTKVCVYSQKNISVPGLGKLLRGYQMVEKSLADQWAEKPYARIATPEEVAREFRK